METKAPDAKGSYEPIFSFFSKSVKTYDDKAILLFHHLSELPRKSLLVRASFLPARQRSAQRHTGHGSLSCHAVDGTVVALSLRTACRLGGSLQQGGGSTAGYHPDRCHAADRHRLHFHCRLLFAARCTV